MLLDTSIKKPISTFMATSSLDVSEAAIPTFIPTFVKSIEVKVSLKGDLQGFFLDTQHTHCLHSATH